MHWVIFLMFFKLEQHKSWKLGKTDFEKKRLFWDFWGKSFKNGWEMRFLKFYREWKLDLFLIFWMKFHQHRIALKNFCCCCFLMSNISLWRFGWNHLNGIYLFSCFKFVELFIKITLSVMRIDCENFCWKITCSDKIRVFRIDWTASLLTTSIVCPMPCYTCFCDETVLTGLSLTL